MHYANNYFVLLHITKKDNSMIIGLVKWFDIQKGFGVVGIPDGVEYFIHKNNFSTKTDEIFKGTPIAFVPNVENAKSRKNAASCRLVGELDDWKIIFNHLGKMDNVKIEVDVNGQGRLGNKYHHKEIRSFSLMKIALKHYLSNKNEEEIENVAIDYFNNDLDKNQFLLYCELIEFSISRCFSEEKSNNIQNKIFYYFGQNITEELLFVVWKKMKFKFISYNDMDDYEISESVLKANIQNLEETDFERIKNYSCSASFFTHYLNLKINKVVDSSSSEILKLYDLIEFELKTNQDIRKEQLDQLLKKRVEIELIDRVKCLNIIADVTDIHKYINLLKLVPQRLNDNEKNDIIKSLYTMMAQKCTDELKPELWIAGIVEDLPRECVFEFFLDSKTQIEKRISILRKLNTTEQLELLIKYTDENTIEKSFAILEILVKKENSLDSNFDLKPVLYSSEFWKNKKNYELVDLFTTYVCSVINDEIKYDLFIKGYIQNVPQEMIFANIHKITRNDFKKIFKSQSNNQSIIFDILNQKIRSCDTNSLPWLFDFAIEFLDNEWFDLFDKNVFNLINSSDYFNLWQLGKGKILPEKQIEEFLQDKIENYIKIETLIKQNVISQEKFAEYILLYLNKDIAVTDRIVFYKKIYHIKCLLHINDFYIGRIKNIENDFYNLILWVLDNEISFNFDLLKQKFIYFESDDQIRIIRKLFYCKATGQFDFSLEELNELTRIDLDLYESILKLNTAMSVDISTDVVIKALISFSVNQRFILENELFQTVLNDLLIDKTRRFKLSNYFEDCLGRLAPEFNWKRNGVVTKVRFNDHSFYFEIKFGYDPDLVNAVKSIPRRIWDNEFKVWRVPSESENEVLHFARANRFFLNFDGNNYTDNIHLAEFKRTINENNTIKPNIPSGIMFCEGRKANKQHEMFKKDFWWCAGQPCFDKCETLHTSDDWESYTLLDFCEILGYNTDETNRVGDFIEKGKYYQFIALINRFNRLLDKLYCEDCGHILYPSDFGTGHFAAHTIVRFQCRNHKCNNNNEIYLNHCLNGQCNNIIDSRVSKKCDNGLFICDKCGSCCSHKMFENRLSNLELTGGHIHQSLLRCLNEKLGHLERAFYFCHKCGLEMSEISVDIYKCLSCNVKYDTTKYKFKRPHKGLKIAK